MELLILLIERRGELVTREEIAERLWGKDIFVDVDHSINVAVRKIRVALRDDPDKPRFVETVVGKGYRFAAPVVSNNGDSKKVQQTVHASANIVATNSDSPPDRSKTRFSSYRLILWLGGTVVMALVAVAWILHGSDSRVSAPPIRSLAVLPLKNLSGNPTQEYLADGLTEDIIGRLASISGLRVISRTSSMHF